MYLRLVSTCEVLGAVPWMMAVVDFSSITYVIVGFKDRKACMKTCCQGLTHNRHSVHICWIWIQWEKSTETATSAVSSYQVSVEAVFLARMGCHVGGTDLGAHAGLVVCESRVPGDNRKPQGRSDLQSRAWIGRTIRHQPGFHCDQAVSMKSTLDAGSPQHLFLVERLFTDSMFFTVTFVCVY